MADRSGDWLKQAERDLQVAQGSQRAGSHEWACFAAHQAAEKAIKAVHLAFSQSMWGHILVDLLTELPSDAPRPSSRLVELARILDNYYVPTRYPDGHVAGAPFEHYGPMQSEQAISHAGEILEYARDAVAEAPRG